MQGLKDAWHRRSIAVKLPTSIGVLVAIAMLAMALLAYGRVRRAMLTVADERLVGVSRQMSGLLQGNALQRYAVLERIARDESIRAQVEQPSRVDSTVVERRLREHGTSTPAILGVELRAADLSPRIAWGDVPRTYPMATLRAVTGSAGASDGATGPYFAIGDTIVYPSLVAVPTGTSSSGWIVEWRRLTGSPAAARELSNLIGSDARLLVGNRDGRFWTDLAQAAPGPGAPIGDSLTRYGRADGVAVIARAADVPTTAWTVAVELSQDRVVAPARHLLVTATGIALLLGLAGATAGTIISRNITTPLRAVATAATDLARGKDAAVGVDREDEIGQLERAFNSMAEQISLGRTELANTLTDYQLLFDRNPLPLLVNDRQTLAILHVNDAAVRAYGYSREEFLERTLLDLRPADDADQCRELLARPDYEPGITERWTHQRRDGSLMEVEVTRAHLMMRGRPVAFVLVNDVSERVAAEGALAQSNEALRRSQEQLLHAQKMEALGRLAGAVAHDFNNLTAAILGYAELLGSSLDTSDPRRADAEEIRRAANRAAELTSRLLSFSRRQIAELRPVQLNEIVAQTERLLRRLIGEDIELATSLDPRATPVTSDPVLVEQALLNLAVNARDAMPRGGALTIETVPVVLDGVYVERHLDARLGPHVLLAVSDTGSGIPPELLSRVFEPFFTTKAPGQGTGIGLSTVYGIVRQSGGHVDVYTEVGRGTVFKLYFPTAPAGTAQPQTPVDAPAAHAGGDETILLVEDDGAVRAVTRRVLDVLGYRTIEAATSSSALELAADPSADIALVLTDVVMPDMSGPEMAAILRRRLPQARVVFMSGYTDDAVVRHGMLPAGTHFLQKPFSLQQLAVKLREVLDQPA